MQPMFNLYIEFKRVLSYACLKVQLTNNFGSNKCFDNANNVDCDFCIVIAQITCMIMILGEERNTHTQKYVTGIANANYS